MVYLDGVFVLNAALDALLLSATGKLTGRAVKPGRLALAAAIGGGYACAVFLPGLEGLSGAPGQVGSLAVMLLAVFGVRLLWPGGVLLTLSCALGGAILLLERLVGSLSYANGIPGTAWDGELLLLAGSGLWAAASLLERRASGKSGKKVPVLLEVNGKRRLLTALVDSGNGLRDPISGKGVLVAEWDALAACLPEKITQAACAAPAEHLAEMSAVWPEGRLRLLPCRTVRQTEGFLLAFTAQRAKVDGVERGALPVAISPVRLSDGAYQALIGL
ncbi:MAG: sigma-E processing peptidase SpoIIGA [Clostridiales bacterium]|nr:sigma-E processing peptidase SpoIIGA [Clostridiales bacterium]